VTIIERDRFPEGPAPRRGVPQAHHLHVQLKRGRVILERLFPGLDEGLVSAGAPVVDMANDVAWLTPAGWGIRYPSEPRMIAFSRDLLDFEVRRRLLASGVRFLEGCDVVGLLPGAGGVAGVRVRTRAGEEGMGVDLVVDATGEDYRYRGTEGGSPDRMTRFMHRYMDRVMELSTKDAGVRLRLLEAFNLIGPPTTLFHPSLAAKVLRRQLSRQHGASLVPDERELPKAA
jgi:hypothetical protein